MEVDFAVAVYEIHRYGIRVSVVSVQRQRAVGGLCKDIFYFSPGKRLILQSHLSEHNKFSFRSCVDPYINSAKYMNIIQHGGAKVNAGRMTLPVRTTGANDLY